MNILLIILILEEIAMSTKQENVKSKVESTKIDQNKKTPLIISSGAPGAPITSSGAPGAAPIVPNAAVENSQKMKAAAASTSKASATTTVAVKSLEQYKSISDGPSAVKMLGNMPQQFEDPTTFLRSRSAEDLVKLIASWKIKAAQGDSHAQCNLGAMYREGIGVDKDEKEAVKLYQLAAAQGHSIAQFNLGACYEDGIGGLEKDEKEAVRLYQLAAAQGNSGAQCNLGFCYLNGIGGLEKNGEKAVSFFKLSADQKNSEAQSNLGYCYRFGIGVDEDVQKAFEFLQLAVAQGNAAAQLNLGDCYERGIGVGMDKKKACDLYKLSMDQGNVGAQFKLGLCYYHGIGVHKQNKIEGLRLIRLAKINGHKEAAAIHDKLVKEEKQMLLQFPLVPLQPQQFTYPVCGMTLDNEGDLILDIPKNLSHPKKV